MMRIFGVFTCVYMFLNWVLVRQVFVSSLAWFSETPVCCSKHGMARHEVGNSRQRHSDF